MCLWVETSKQAISMTLVSVTSLPSLMTLALILSEAKPMMIVSQSTLFHIAPSGYSASFTNLSAFDVKVLQTQRFLEQSLQLNCCD